VLDTAEDDVCAAVAYVKRGAVGLIQREVQALRARGGRLRLVTTSQFRFTDPEAVGTLTKLGADVRLHPSHPTFHSKLFLARCGGQPTLLLGSANLSEGALIGRNVESGVLLSGPAAAAPFDDARAHFDRIWQASAAVVAAAPPPPRPVPPLHQQIRALVARQAIATTATGAPNRLLRWHEQLGILVGTARSPAGQWVPWWMFDVVETWIAANGPLRLNPTCTTYLRVHRSSAVFAVLGALPGYRFHARRPAVLGPA